MKSIKAILILTVMISSANAQPIRGVRSSALMPGDSAIFNVDFLDPFGLPGYDVSVRARMGMGDEEYSIPLSHANFPPYYVNTYEGSWVFEEPTASISFYGRVDADTIVISQSYKNSGNQMPPDPILYADLATDPAGDTAEGTSGPWLDLTGSGITYSDTRVFGRLDNVGGGWPQNQGFEYYFYAFILLPTDSLSTTVTAMVYGNIPFIFTPGLYTLDLADTSFQYIADIEYGVSSSLHLSCSIEDLLSAPGWYTWPPENGFVATSAVTFSVAFTTPSFNDFTFPSAFVPETQYRQTTGNSPPELGWEIDPVPHERIDANVYYSDPDNNLPVEKLFYFDDQPHEMGTYDRDYTDMARFEYSHEWPGGGWHTYYFRFFDGAAAVETELDSIYLSPISADDQPVPGQFALCQNYPNPFNAQTSIEYDLAEPSFVNLAIYDISGNLVTLLAEKHENAGSYSVVWDGENSAGQSVTSGVYFYKLSSEGYTDTKRMLLLK